MSALKVISFVILAAVLATAIGAWRWGSALQAQTSAGVQALQKAKVLERLVERTASKTGTAPSFVLDPAWPRVLPHNWVIGDVGGSTSIRTITSGCITVREPCRPPIAVRKAWVARTQKAN